MLREATISCLRTGHSHEDVDQAFGRLAQFVAQNAKKAETPNDFVNIINAWLQQADFPHEPPSRRYALKMDQSRDWPADSILEDLFFLSLLRLHVYSFIIFSLDT